MTIKDIQNLLTAMSQVLAAIKDFPVFEEVIEDDSYYTMSDLTMGDAIQALDEIVQGIECRNCLDQVSDSCLMSPDLEAAITALSELGMSIICANRASRPSEGKLATAKKRE